MTVFWAIIRQKVNFWPILAHKCAMYANWVRCGKDLMACNSRPIYQLFIKKKLASIIGGKYHKNGANHFPLILGQF